MPDRNFVKTVLGLEVRVFVQYIAVSLGIGAGYALARESSLEDFWSAAGDPSGWWLFCVPIYNIYGDISMAWTIGSWHLSS